MALNLFLSLKHKLQVIINFGFEISCIIFDYEMNKSMAHLNLS